MHPVGSVMCYKQDSFRMGCEHSHPPASLCVENGQPPLHGIIVAHCIDFHSNGMVFKPCKLFSHDLSPFRFIENIFVLDLSFSLGLGLR